MPYVNVVMKTYLIGPCYCKHASGGINNNKVMCIDDANHEGWDLCNKDQWCVGPTTPDDAKLFSRNLFCSKGE